MKGWSIMEHLATLTYDQAEHAYCVGTLSARDFNRFCRAWRWSAFRYTDGPQARYQHRHGYAALMQRINRVRRALRLEPLPV